MKKEDLKNKYSENPNEETIKAVRNWIKSNLEPRKGFKCRNRPCKSNCEYTQNIGYISKRTFMECLLVEGYQIKNYDNYEVNCVFRKNYDIDEEHRKFRKQ